MTELQQATTRQLVNELRERYPVLVFAGLQDSPGDTNAEDIVFISEGSPTAGYGLAGRLLSFVKGSLGKSEPWDDEAEGEP